MLSGTARVEAHTGLEGLRVYRDRLPGWLDRDDLRELAAYASGCIEKYGTGGGNFRALYAAFLRSAVELLPEAVDAGMPEMAARSSERWTGLAGSLRRLAAGGGAEAMRSCTAALGEIVETETQLFETLGRRLGV